MLTVNLPKIDYPEPAFRHFSSKHLLPEPRDTQALLHLRSRVAFMPGDLLSHTQRVLLCYHLSDPDQTFGALVDLFVATGANALPLRNTLLSRCQALLSLEQRAILTLHLVNGLSSISAPNCTQSVLGSGYISQLSAVSKAH